MVNNSSTTPKRNSDTTDGIRKGRTGPFAITPDWIVLAAVSPQAKALYTTLQAHVNQRRGDGVVWPGMNAIADMLGFKHRQSIQRYVAELVDLGAVDVECKSHSRGRHNVYTVHETPPTGYEGLISLAEFYAARERGGSPQVATGGSPQTAIGGNPQVARTRRREQDEEELKALKDRPLVDATSVGVCASAHTGVSAKSGATVNQQPHSIRLAGQDAGQKARTLVKAWTAMMYEIGIYPSKDARDRAGSGLKDKILAGATDDELRAFVRNHVARLAEQRRKPQTEAEFAEFLNAYPRRAPEASRALAFDAWKDAVRSGVAPDALLRAAGAFAVEVRRARLKSCPYPHTWLMQRRWCHAGAAA